MRAEDIRYPLHWPSGWVRTAKPIRSPFSARYMAIAVTKLLQDLTGAGADPSSIQISTNVPLNGSGRARSGEPQPVDRGVAVYFRLDGEQMVSACDRWDRVEDNVYAIARDIETARARTQWGATTMDRVLAGNRYDALPAPTIAQVEQEAPMESRRRKHCGFCGLAGHTRPTCPAIRKLYESHGAA